MNNFNTELVQITDKEVKYHVTNVAEAKLVIKQLRLKKKEFGLEKRVVLEKQKEIRAQYTTEVRHRGSMVRGGGGLSKFIRRVQAVSRDSKRSNLANALAPLESKKQQIERIMTAIDSAILQLEEVILKQQPG